MAYTIKGLARVNECETHDIKGIADQWNYWYICNFGGRKDIINDYKSLRKKDRKEMLDYLRSEPCYNDIYEHITAHLF